MEEGRWTVSEAIRTARGEQSIRALARESHVSAGQISRIEAGEVQRPSAETLVAIARALFLNPVPLLILSGHIGDQEARRRLADMLSEGTEVHEEWMTNPQDVGEARDVLSDPNSPLDGVHHIAFDMFVGEPLAETSWDDSFLLLAAPQSTSSLRELAQLWAEVSFDRRPRALDYLRDQVALSRREAMTAGPGPTLDGL